MEESEYQKLYQLEISHWWYLGLQDLIRLHLKGSGSAPERILDGGCGTGGMAKMLGDRGTIYGIDVARTAVTKSKQRNLNRIVRGSVMNIPFPDKSFDVVLSSDVLYHSLVNDDAKALQEFYRVLKPSGRLILHLPAFRFLWSSHDRSIHTRKRYSRNEITQMLKAAGFRSEKVSYRLFFLFPLILFWRILKKNSGSGSDVWKTPTVINYFLFQILKLENRILKHINLPFGSSVFCVARKQEA